MGGESSGLAVVEKIMITYPVRKFRARADVKSVAELLSETRKIDADGNVGYIDKYGVLGDCIEILSMKFIDEDVCRRDARAIVRNALFWKEKRDIKITPGTLKAWIETKETEYRNQRSIELHLVSSILVPRKIFNPVERKVPGGHLSIQDKLPGNYTRHPQEYLEPKFLIEKQLGWYTILTLEAKTIWEAYQRGCDILDRHRGAWNLALNKGIWHDISYEQPHTINLIAPGPITTIHNPDGSLASDVMWYDDYCPGPSQNRLQIEQKVFKHITDFEQEILGKTSTSKYKELIEQFIVQYCRSLDTADFSKAFMMLWALIERITGKTGQDYDAVVQRSTAVMDNCPDLASATMEYLRATRNQVVHHSHHPEKDEGMREDVLRLHRYAVRLLLATLKDEYQDIDEFTEFGAILGYVQDPDLESKMRKSKNDLRLHAAAARIRKGQVKKSKPASLTVFGEDGQIINQAE